MKEEDRKLQDQINSMQNDLIKVEEMLMKRTENNERLKKSLDVDKGILREKEKECEALRTKITGLKVEISCKKDGLRAKKDELLRLQRQKELLEESVKKEF